MYLLLWSLQIEDHGPHHTLLSRQKFLTKQFILQLIYNYIILQIYIKYLCYLGHIISFILFWDASFSNSRPSQTFCHLQQWIPKFIFTCQIYFPILLKCASSFSFSPFTLLNTTVKGLQSLIFPATVLASPIILKLLALRKVCQMHQ